MCQNPGNLGTEKGFKCDMFYNTICNIARYADDNTLYFSTFNLDIKIQEIGGMHQQHP